MKKFVAFPATWIFHYLPRCFSAWTVFWDALPKKPKTKSLASGALLPMWNACTPQSPASGASEAQERFGKRLVELQKTVTEPEGCQNEANMGRIYQHKEPKENFSSGFEQCPDFLFVVFKLLDVWQQLWDSKIKWRNYYLSLPKMQSAVLGGLCD